VSLGFDEVEKVTMSFSNSRLLAKVSRKIRKRKQHLRHRKQKQQTQHFQPLEPRVLLSASEPIMFYSSAPVRIVDAGSQIEERVMQVNSAWFEDLAPDVVANVDNGISSLNWRGTDITTISDQWIVQLNDNGLEQANSVSDTFGLLQLDDYNGQVVRGLGMAGLVLIQTELQTDHDVFMDSLIDSGFVDYVQPNAVLENQATPNDPKYANTWGLHNTGQFNGSVSDADIDAPEAWELTTGSANVVVGVIDTGVKWDHEDLVNNMWVNPGEISGNGIDDDGNGFIDDVYGYDFVNNDGNPMDDHGHGTHVAGTIAADGNNGKGVAGVSWNSKIMGLKFMSSSGSGSTSDAVRAINYATMMKESYGVNILVTCNSWGGGGYSSSLYNAIVANKNADMLFMAAAGNDSTNNDNGPHYPSNYDVDNVISVASTDWADGLSSFSNYGASTVDVAAPGSYIYSTTYDGSYGYKSGTSMATPQVAGLAALAWSYSPDSTWQQIKAAILDNGDTLSSLNNKVATGKRINALNTLNALTPAVPEANIDVSNLIVGTIRDDHSSVYDLGEFTEGVDDTREFYFNIYNSGTSNLEVSNLSIPAGFTLVQDITTDPIAPGDEIDFILKIDTSSGFGSKTGTVSFTTNDPDSTTFNFDINVDYVEATSWIAIKEGSSFVQHNSTYTVDTVAQNATSQVTLTLANGGYAALNINSFTVSGDFSLTSTVPTTIGSEASTTFTFAMDTSTIGNKSGQIVINSDAENQASFVINLAGAAVDPSSLVEVAVLDSNGNELADGSSTPYTFGNKTQNKTLRKTFTVTNTGSAALTLSGLTATGDFEIVNDLPASIAANSSATFTVEMDTSSIGDKSGSITFNSNDADESPYTVLLEGTVTAAPVPQEVKVTYSGGEITDGQGTAIDFGDLDYGDSEPEITFTVSNIGDKKLTTSGLNVGSGFSIVEGLDQSINAGESDTFTIRMLTNAAGEKNASIKFYSNDEDEATFNFDITGSVEAPANGIDLSVAWADDADSYFTPGKKSKVLVDVTNNGIIAMADSVTINVYGNTSNTLDGDEILLGTVTKTLNLKPDQTKTNRVTIELDSSIPADDYYLFAVVDPDNAIAEANENNNSAVTSATTEVAWKFGDLGDGKKTQLKLTDDDGTLIRFSLSGKGIGEVVANNDGTWSVFITGTTSSSKVAINGRGGDDRVTLRDVIIGDPNDDSDNTGLAQFAGKRLDLDGGVFTATGAVQKLVLGDVTDTTMTFDGNYGRGTDLTLGQLTDVTINADTGFNKLTIINWTDSDVTEDAINARWINKLSVKGSKGNGVSGNFDTNLTLTGEGAGRYTLDTISVKGEVNGRTWDINGNIKAMKVDSFVDSDIDIDGHTAKLSIGHMLGGSLTVKSVDKLATTIAKYVDGSTGDFTADLNITGNKSSKFSVKTLSIKGDVENANWDVAGKIGALVVKGNTDGLTLNVVDEDDLKLDAQLDKLVLNTVDDADITVEGTIGFVKAVSWTTGSITAEEITKSKLPA
tara:strand:- start:134 stop:4666 length:4533 start_codon:yes stop_codon:yes gene_type:complete